MQQAKGVSHWSHRAMAHLPVWLAGAVNELALCSETLLLEDVFRDDITDFALWPGEDGGAPEYFKCSA